MQQEQAIHSERAEEVVCPECGTPTGFIYASENYTVETDLCRKCLWEAFQWAFYGGPVPEVAAISSVK